MTFVRQHITLPEEQIDFLKDINEVSVSEHIRRATTEYIERIKKDTLKVSTSQSK